jgi:hypothetical protein
MSSPVPAEERGRGRFGFGGWALLLCLALLGAWILFTTLLDAARPILREVTIALIAFTIGMFYGRFRRYERDEKRKNPKLPQ